MWEEYVQVDHIFGVISVVVGTIVVGINVIGHHLLRAVYKGFRIANGFSIVILVFIKLFNLLQVCTYLQRYWSRGRGIACPQFLANQCTPLRTDGISGLKSQILKPPFLS